jgi:hypothetical protein
LVGGPAKILDSGPTTFDGVIVNHAGGDANSLARELANAASLLGGRGKLWLFERYDALESSRERVVEHPLSRLRRLLRESGFVCKRLMPIEADGEHILATVAQPSESVAHGLPVEKATSAA